MSLQWISSPKVVFAMNFGRTGAWREGKFSFFKINKHWNVKRCVGALRAAHTPQVFLRVALRIHGVQRSMWLVRQCREDRPFLCAPVSHPVRSFQRCLLELLPVKRVCRLTVVVVLLLFCCVFLCWFCMQYAVGVSCSVKKRTDWGVWFLSNDQFDLIRTLRRL